jgi:hypothetical protein
MPFLFIPQSNKLMPLLTYQKVIKKKKSTPIAKQDYYGYNSTQQNLNSKLGRYNIVLITKAYASVIMSMTWAYKILILFLLATLSFGFHFHAGKLQFFLLYSID